MNTILGILKKLLVSSRNPNVIIYMPNINGSPYMMLCDND